MHVKTSAVVTALLAMTAAAAPAAQAATPAANASPLALHCSAHVLPVALADPGPADQSMWGELCYRGARAPSTVQLLVHGATYDLRCTSSAAPTSR